jgi:hypothetical protein
MTTTLAALILLASLSGLWVWLDWRRAAADQASGARLAKLTEIRSFAHGLAAGLVLIALLLGLDNHAPQDAPRLIILFLCIATGMLLFLKRQRLQAFPGGLLIVHAGMALLALLLAVQVFV